MWAHNLEDEFKEICRIVADFNYVAMDTEFPGVVARPIGEFKSTSDYQYQVSHSLTDIKIGPMIILCWEIMSIFAAAEVQC